MKELPEEFSQQQIRDLGWTDVHTHLNFLDITPEEAIKQGLEKGVNRFITIGTEPADHQIVLDLADQFAPHVFCTLGVHPHEGKVYSDEVEQFLKANLAKPRVVAVGEIGLDYYYDSSPRDQQLDSFRKQMQLAVDLDMPVEIHTRDAEDDTIEILNEYKGKVKGIIHCFTGTQKLATAALDCGYNISYSGIVTFKNAQDLRDVCLNTPIDRMHVETDAPFLAPVPVRGKKNVPDNVLWVAKFVSELKQVPLFEFCQQMKINAEKMFPKLISN